MKKSFLSLIAICGFTFSMNVTAQGIPTIDFQTVGQSTISAMENVAQTLKQIDQYRTQLQQYENQLMNSTPLSSAQWQDAQRIMNSMNSIINSSQNLIGFGNNLDSYLDKFKTPDYYMNHTKNCFIADGCYDDSNKNKDQREINNANFKTIEQQQKELVNDAQRLQQLQRQAMGAEGQMQAIQVTNQLAAAQTAQLMQMRSALLTQQKMMTTYLANQQDKEAKEKAQQETAIKFKAEEENKPFKMFK